MKIEESEITKHFNWYLESCKRFKRKPIDYNLFEKEFIEMKKDNEKPERKEELERIGQALKKAQELLL